MGDNALALVQHLGNLDFDADENKESQTSMVFFDVFGLFMISYTETVGIIINYVVAVIFILITILDGNYTKLNYDHYQIAYELWAQEF